MSKSPQDREAIISVTSLSLSYRNFLVANQIAQESQILLALQTLIHPSVQTFAEKKVTKNAVKGKGEELK